MYRWLLRKIFTFTSRELQRLRRAEIARMHREMDARYDREYVGYLTNDK